MTWQFIPNTNDKYEMSTDKQIRNTKRIIFKKSRLARLTAAAAAAAKSLQSCPPL